MKSILDVMYERFLKEGRGFAEQEILKEFFRIDSASSEMASKVVEPLLGGDPRFMRLPDRTWSAVRRVAPEQLPISQTSFVLFAIDDPEGRHLPPSGERTAGETRVKEPDGAPLEHPSLQSESAAADPLTLVGEYSSFVLYRNGAESRENSLREMLNNTSRYVFIPHDTRSLARLKKICRAVSPLAPDLKTLSVRTLISLLYPDRKLKTWDDITREFSIVSVQSESPSSRVTTLKSLFEFLLAAVSSRGFTRLGELLDFQRQAGKKVDFSRYGFDKEFLKDIPEQPGVYLFRDREGRVIYVGKTNNLKVRIHSYFWNTGESLDKIEGILGRLSTIEYRILGSDLEAMIEEYRLIDEHKPPFNTKMKIPVRAIEVGDTILILPSAAQGMVKLFFLSSRIPLEQLDFDCGGKDDGPVLEVLKRMEAARRAPPGAGGTIAGEPAEYTPKGFDPLKVLALFYLRRYDESLNTVDVDRYRSAEEVVRVLHLHCSNLESLFKEKTTYIE